MLMIVSIGPGGEDSPRRGCGTGWHWLVRPGLRGDRDTNNKALLASVRSATLGALITKRQRVLPAANKRAAISSVDMPCRRRASGMA